jgi:4-amino-4-deoxy-L-arabinose transferase-like glycosyltransferase
MVRLKKTEGWQGRRTMPIMASLRGWGAEGILAVVAGAAFLGFLGSTDLWGKREQRASAEALDTVDHNRWLVAEIQGRPRLEKPPLPRWITAGLIIVTGRRDETIVRLPNALAGLSMVGLVYWLGRGLGGRAVGLASGFALASSFNFLVEMRQAGNDGMLALFTTLALLAGWKRLHGPSEGDEVERPGSRVWSFVFYGALGLGFLTKGPIILLMVALTIVGYLATARRLGSGLRSLADGWGLAIFVVLAMAWPVPVLLRDPASARVWWLEIAQKTGALDIPHDKVRESVALDWFWMTLPWTPLAMAAALWPLRKSSRAERPRLAFVWWWAIGNLGVLALWKVAKPSYYLPCMPGVALLVGSEWVRLTRLARVPARGSILARGVLQAFWVTIFVGAAMAPVLVGKLAPIELSWAMAGGMALAIGVVAGAWAWRRGFDAGAMIPLASGFVAVALIAYGAIAPMENPARGHRELARRLEAIVPADSPTVWFFNDVDEGLWFYLKGHELTPVAAAKFNRGFDLRVDAHDRKIDTPEKRVEQARDQLIDWAKHADPTSPFVLIRAKIYDRFAAEVTDLVEPIYREEAVKRNEMVLLRVRTSPSPIALKPVEAPRH